MNNSSNNSSPDDGEEHGEVVWNEFDWERYLRQNDKAIAEYQACYDSASQNDSRLDEVARQLGWEPSLDGEIPCEENAEEFEEDDLDPYTLHRNPVFIATHALFLSLQENMEMATDAGVSTKMTFPLLRILANAEMCVVMAIQSLDLGDSALGISLLKRALGMLNSAMGHLPGNEATSPAESALQGYALPRLFDLREICLRVMREGRSELDHPADDEDAF
jgi:hypothetical protein